MFQLGFLGGGQMAEAIIGGLKENAAEFSLEYAIYDTSLQRRKYLYDKFDIQVLESNEDVIKHASVLFLAIKPQIYPIIEDVLAKHYREGQIIVSIMAGISMETLGDNLPKAKIVRLMPNTAMAVGAGTCLFTANDFVTEQEKNWLMDLLSTLGLVEEIPEVLMNSAMAISGSGPAFFYTMMEGMVLGGIEVGLSQKLALSLATQTMYGAAKLLEQTEESPSTLKNQVLSPGGTTIEGVRVLEANHFRSTVLEAVVATKDKGEALGHKKGRN